MGRLRHLTAGESHGPCLVGILDGLPRGIPVSRQAIESLLRRRRAGFGRSARQKKEQDCFHLLGGVDQDKTTGNPFCIQIENSLPEGTDMPAQEVQPARGKRDRGLTCPRPGHADFVGALKWNEADFRDVAERASARETAVLTALSVPPRALLASLGVQSLALVARLGPISTRIPAGTSWKELARAVEENGAEWLSPSADVIAEWRELVKTASASGDSLGGSVQIRVRGVIPGLGGFSQRDTRLDGRLAGVLMALPGVKAVEIGSAFLASISRGSLAADELRFSNRSGVRRTRNLGGGLEGGMANGEDLEIQLLMKPIPTVAGRMSFSLKTRQPAMAECPRHDTVALAALAVAAESAVAIELAGAYLEQFGGATLEDTKAAWNAYAKRIKPLWRPRT